MSRSILITGAASGIGKAACAYLAERGWRVIGVDIKNADINADLATPAGRAEMVRQAEELSGGVLDAVIACAGLAVFEPITVSVNYFGALATLAGLRPLLEKGVAPRAVAVSSLAITMEYDEALVEACLAGDEQKALEVAHDKGQVIYASTKVALTRWCRSQAISPEWAGAGIPLNLIAPGLIQTPMTQAMIDDPEMMAYMENLMPTPIGHYGQPEDVAPLLGFLASAENSHMVGQLIYIDGGSEAATRGAQVY